MKQYVLVAVFKLFFGVLYAQNETILSNAYIVDVRSGTLMASPKDVVISGGTISNLIEATSYRGNGTVIDCEGKYIIPGLWDMHAHPDDPEMWRMNPTKEARDQLMPLFVLYGVKGIRDMAGDMNVVNTWRKEIRNGVLLGPEIIAGGPLIDGPNPMWDGSIGIPSTEMVKFKVDSLIRSGVDFLKVYSLLPDSIYFALSEYANKISFPFVGHVPLDVTTLEASETGMKSQEHLLNILMDCSSLQNDLYNKTIDYRGITNRLERYIYSNDLMIETYDPEKAHQLFETFVKNETWHTPTISMWYKNAYFEREVKTDEKHLKYLPPYMREYWTPEVNDHLQLRDPDFLLLNQRLVKKYLEVIGEMNRAGVKLLTGTDVGANPLCFPGLGVHYELELLVQAGLSNAEALQTATINPAEFLKMTNRFGSIEKGRIADLIILSKNPLEDITNTKLIEGVMRNGMYISKDDIDQRMRSIAETHGR